MRGHGWRASLAESWPAPEWDLPPRGLGKIWGASVLFASSHEDNAGWKMRGL